MRACTRNMLAFRRNGGTRSCSPSEPLTDAEQRESDKDPTLDEDCGKCNSIRYGAWCRVSKVVQIPLGKDVPEPW
jgi:hypothetical protein